MRIAEIYVSRQGEGRFTGTESTFVRVSGCNLRCVFCDTPYTSWFPEGENWTVEEVLAEVKRLGCGHVVLTGGEPMLFDELVPLTRRLADEAHHITIETAGTVYSPVCCDLMSISPKLSNSTPDPIRYPEWNMRHDMARDAPGVIMRLIDQYDYQCKFVVATRNDLSEISAYLRRFPILDHQRVLLMPEGDSREQLAKVATWLVPACKELGLTYCPRMQIEWYGTARGT